MLVNLRGPRVKFHVILQTQIYARGNKLALNINPTQRNILSSILLLTEFPILLSMLQNFLKIIYIYYDATD